jgi:hypothetical protein
MHEAFFTRGAFQRNKHQIKTALPVSSVIGTLFEGRLLLKKSTIFQESPAWL